MNPSKRINKVQVLIYLDYYDEEALNPNVEIIGVFRTPKELEKEMRKQTKIGRQREDFKIKEFELR